MDKKHIDSYLDGLNEGENWDRQESVIDGTFVVDLLLSKCLNVILKLNKAGIVLDVDFIEKLKTGLIGIHDLSADMLNTGISEDIGFINDSFGNKTKKRGKKQKTIFWLFWLRATNRLGMGKIRRNRIRFC